MVLSNGCALRRLWKEGQKVYDLGGGDSHHASKVFTRKLKCSSGRRRRRRKVNRLVDVAVSWTFCFVRRVVGHRANLGDFNRFEGGVDQPLRGIDFPLNPVPETRCSLAQSKSSKQARQVPVGVAGYVGA